MSALKEELVRCIYGISDEKLFSIKPLLYMLADNDMTLEEVTFDQLDDDEKEAVIQARKEYSNGECVDFEDYLSERNISII